MTELSAGEKPVLVHIKQVGVEVVFDGPTLDVVEALAEAALRQAHANEENSRALRKIASILSGKKHIGVVNAPAINVAHGSSLGIGLTPREPLGFPPAELEDEPVAESAPDPVD